MMTLETYLRFTFYYSLTIWCAYAVYLAVSLRSRRALLSFKIALVCFVLHSEETLRIYLMLDGVLAEAIKPTWLTLLMNIPFGMIIYEIFVRKIGIKVVRQWILFRADGDVLSNEPDELYSALTSRRRSHPRV